MTFSLCTVRIFSLLMMTWKFSEFNESQLDDTALNTGIRLSLDLPTLLLISVFSAFA